MTPAVDHLKSLIRIHSVSSLTNRPIIEYALGVFSAVGWKTLCLPYSDAAGIEKLNLIAAPPGQDPNEPYSDLAFLCHTDTVPYAADWPEALDPQILDGVLYGCGACDVKGFLACLLSVADRTASIPFQAQFRIILTADEEIGCLGSRRLLSQGDFRPKAIIIGEPTLLAPARAGKGYCLAEVTVFGREAHSAHPSMGKSAIYGAARLISAIEEYGASLAQLTNDFFTPNHTTINVGTIQGGTAKNVVAGRCSFQVEWRPLPEESVDRVPKEITRIANQLKEQGKLETFKLEVTREQAGFETKSESTLVRLLQELTGRPSTTIPYGSEASVMASITKQIVVFGPGDMRNAHSPRECVSIAQLESAVHCIEGLIQSFNFQSDLNLVATKE